MPDVDIDFYDRDGVLSLFKHTPATIVKDEMHEKHKTGIYFHDIPVNPSTRHSSLDYKKADERGYFKIDLLNFFRLYFYNSFIRIIFSFTARNIYII